MNRDRIVDWKAYHRWWLLYAKEGLGVPGGPKKGPVFVIRVNFYDFNSTLTLFYDHPFPFTELEFGSPKMRYFFMVALLIIASWKEISTGPWKIFDQADTGPYTILYGKINGATVNFTTGHRSFPNPVFPKIMTGPQIHAPNDFIHDLIHDFILWSKNAILFSLIRYGKQIDFSDFET